MPLWIQNVVLPAVVSVVAGVVGLFIEYRTGWFARGVSTVQKRTDRAANLLIGQSITPVTELESPVGDWMQIAQEIKALLVKVNDFAPDALRLETIIRRLGNRAELRFRCYAKGLRGYIISGIVYTVRVDDEGRIIGFTRQRKKVIR